MARRLERNKAPAPSAVAKAAAEDLAVLHPDVTVKVAGQKITLREYEFFEGLEVAHVASAFITDLLGMCANGELRYARVRRLMGVHRDVVIEIAAQSANVEPAWVRGLKGNDAEIFLSTWFTVNSGFFLREAAVEIEETRHRQAMARRASSSSSSASPATTSATSTASADSPSDS